MKHTKEPWSDSDGYLAGPDSPVNFIMIASPWVEDYLISGSAKPEEIMEARANAARIVECVNALAGIEDPERFVRLAMEVIAAARVVVDRDGLWIEEGGSYSDALAEAVPKLRETLTTMEVAV